MNEGDKKESDTISSVRLNAFGEIDASDTKDPELSTTRPTQSEQDQETDRQRNDGLVVERLQTLKQTLDSARHIHLSSAGEISSQEDFYQVITQEQIKTYIQQLKAKGIDISNIGVHLANPGDNLFSQYEVQTKLMQKYASDWNSYMQIIRAHGFDENNLTVSDLHHIAKLEGITLEGKLPGFTITAGTDEIIFFGIKRENVIEMAQKYAKKHGDYQVDVASEEKALTYLQSLAKEALFHEAGHVAYARLAEQKIEDWNAYIDVNPDISQRVKVLQRDKYDDESQIPVAEEAFADGLVKYVSSGDMGRLDVGKEGVLLIEQFLLPSANA